MLMEAVCGSPLKRLYLGGHGEAFGPAGAAVVAAGLANPDCCLVSISCDLNAMGDEGLALLAKALESNTRLRRFCINRNNITGRGPSFVCDVCGVHDVCNVLCVVRGRACLRLN